MIIIQGSTFQIGKSTKCVNIKPKWHVQRRGAKNKKQKIIFRKNVLSWINAWFRPNQSVAFVKIMVFLLLFVVCTSVGGGGEMVVVVLVERWEHLKTTISDLSPKGFVECWCQKENIYQIFFNLSKKYLLKKRTVCVYNPYTFLGRFLGGFWVPFSLGNDINVSNCNFRREP